MSPSPSWKSSSPWPRPVFLPGRRAAGHHAIGRVSRQGPGERAGVTLFSRERAAAELTDEGQRLWCAPTRCCRCRGPAAGRRPRARAAEGILRVGSLAPPPRCASCRPAGRYAQRHPGITVRIDEEDDDTVVRWLEERRWRSASWCCPTSARDLARGRGRVPGDAARAPPTGGQAGHPPQRPHGRAFVLSGAGCGDLIQNALARHGARLNILYRFPQLLSLWASSSAAWRCRWQRGFLCLTTTPAWSTARSRPPCPAAWGWPCAPWTSSPAARAFMKVARRCTPRRRPSCGREPRLAQAFVGMRPGVPGCLGSQAAPHPRPSAAAPPLPGGQASPPRHPSPHSAAWNAAFAKPSRGRATILG